MKKVIQNMAAVVIGGLLFPQLQAQPSLTNSVFPSIGQTVITIEADTVGVLEGNAGANQNWNFSGLMPLAGGYADTANYIAASGTPYAMDFPTANLAIQSLGDDYYSYVKKETNELTFLGAAGPDIIFEYADPITFLKTPLAFNGSFSDDYAALVQPDSTTTIYETGTRTVLYDAYGSLSCPTGNFTNVIRLKTISEERDSLNLGMGYAINETFETSYDWWVAGTTNPLVTISYSEGTSTIFFPPFPPTVTSSPLSQTVSYLSSTTTGISDQEPAISLLQVSPNPAVEVLQVSLSAASGLEEVPISIVNGIGQILWHENVILQEGSNLFSIQVGQLPAGAYWLQLQFPQGVKSKAWIKQ